MIAIIDAISSEMSLKNAEEMKVSKTKSFFQIRKKEWWTKIEEIDAKEERNECKLLKWIKFVFDMNDIG